MFGATNSIPSEHIHPEVCRTARTSGIAEQESSRLTTLADDRRRTISKTRNRAKAKTSSTESARVKSAKPQIPPTISQRQRSPRNAVMLIATANIVKNIARVSARMYRVQNTVNHERHPWIISDDIPASFLKDGGARLKETKATSKQVITSIALCAILTAKLFSPNTA